MAAIRRKVMGFKIPDFQELAAAGDLNGVADGSKNIDVSGCLRVLVFQVNDGAAGTTGVDVVQISHDGGVQWEPDPTLLAIASDDQTGTVVADGALNVAGVEPTLFAAFKSGPHPGPTLMRCIRDDAATFAGAALDWTTGAPSVDCLRIGA